MHGRYQLHARRLRGTALARVSAWARLATLLLTLALAACSAASEDAAAGPSNPWIMGGQTGSLMPRCGLPPVAIQDGVPASAESFVLYASECDGALPLSAVTLHDAQGHSIGFDSQMLAEGAVLITPHSMLPPGSYRVGGNVTSVIEEDAGRVDDDAGMGSGGESMGGELTGGEVLNVLPVAPTPTRLGGLSQVGGDCSPTFELDVDPATEAYASLLALDVQVDGGPAQPYFVYGTLELTNGGALITLPEDLWYSLSAGSHTLTLIGRIAGQDAPLESVTVSFDIGWCDSDTPEEEPTGCSIARASHAPSDRLAWSSAGVAAALFAMRKRKRKRAPG